MTPGSLHCSSYQSTKPHWNENPPTSIPYPEISYIVIHLQGFSFLLWNNMLICDHYWLSLNVRIFIKSNVCSYKFLVLCRSADIADGQGVRHMLPQSTGFILSLFLQWTHPLLVHFQILHINNLRFFLKS